jgi:hypothetical protein
LSISIEGRQRLVLKGRLACPLLGRNQEEHGAKKAKKYPRRSSNGLVSQLREKDEQSRGMRNRNAKPSDHESYERAKKIASQ